MLLKSDIGWMQNDDLVEIAFTTNESELPTDFNFTCCCFIQTSHLLQKPPFSVNKSFVAGTKEGPLVIFKISDNSIEPVSLLCSHEFEVTDVITLLQSKRFISVSLDGTLCIWCSKDGSCVKRIKDIIKPGILRLALHPTHTSLIWVWSLGVRADLLDISNNSIVISLDLPGLKSFSFMTPKNTIFVKDDSLVAILNNSQKIFHINDKNEITNTITQKITRHNEQGNYNFVATQYGLILIKKKSFLILYEHGNTKEKELEIPDNDEIAYLYWETKKTLMIATYGGLFFVVSFSHVMKGNDRITIKDVKLLPSFQKPEPPIQTQKSKHNDMKAPPKLKRINLFISSQVEYSTAEDGICFIHKGKEPGYYSLANEKIILFQPKKSKRDIYQIPIENKQLILNSHDQNKFVLYDWLGEKYFRSAILTKSPSKSKNQQQHLTHSHSSPHVNDKEIKTITHETHSNEQLEKQQKTDDINSNKKSNINENIHDKSPEKNNKEKLSHEKQSKHSYTMLQKLQCETPSKVTSLFTLPVHKDHEFMILAGLENGSVSMFWPNSPKPIRNVEAISSKVINFCRLNFKIGGRDPVIVFGDDGSAAIIKWLDVMVRYPATLFPIIEVYLQKEQSFIIFKYLDGTIHVCDFSHSNIVASLSTLPENITKIFPAQEEKDNKTNTFTEKIQFRQNNSVYITKIRINGISSCKTEEQELINQRVLKLLLPSLSDSPQQLEQKDTTLENDSLVLVNSSAGSHTFFYKPYLLKGSVAYSASSRISGFHYIASRILSSMFSSVKAPQFASDQNVPIFLPFLTHYINHSDEDIRRMSVFACANTATVISVDDAQEIITNFISNGSTLDNDSDLFLFSMIVIAQPSTVPDKYYIQLYNFLTKRMRQSDEGSGLAIVLLLDGFEFWGKVSQNSSLLLEILREIITRERIKHILSIFAMVAGVKMPEFSAAFERIIEENCNTNNNTSLSTPQETVRRLFEVTRYVAFTNIGNGGTSISLRIAMVGSKYPKFEQLVSDEMVYHCQNFKCAVSSPNYLLICVRGNVDAFKNGSHLFTLTLFERSSISNIFISPNEVRAIAISTEEKTAKIFNLTPKKTSIIGTKKPFIENELPTDPKNQFSVSWNENDECVFQQDSSV